MGAFQILWVYYGMLIFSRPVIIWNVIAVFINFLTVGAYAYFLRKEKEKSLTANHWIEIEFVKECVDETVRSNTT